MRVYRQTKRHADTMIALLCTPTSTKANINLHITEKQHHTCSKLNTG